METADPNVPLSPVSLNLYQRLPKGRPLPIYAVEYFNQLVAYYLSLDFGPDTLSNIKAKAVADALIKEQADSRLNWGDLSGLEMALLQLLPELNLRRLAWSLRARYREVAGQSWYDQYAQSQPPGLALPPSAGAVTPTQPSAALLSTLTAPPSEAGTERDSDAQGSAGTGDGTPAPGPADGAASASTPEMSAAVTLVVPVADLRADLAVLLSELQRLRAVALAREEQRNQIVGWAAVVTSVLLAVALLLFFLVPKSNPKPPTSNKADTTLTQPHTAIGFRATAVGDPRVILAATTGTPAVDDAATPPSTGNSAPPAQGQPASPDAATPDAVTPDAVTPPGALPSDWKIVLLVIAAGATGGLISMLRRIQSAVGAGTALQETIALDAGKLSAILSPIYGAVFAVVLYLIFMGDLFGATLGGGGIVPKFNSATGQLDNFASFAKLLVWSFVAGFAEKFVPDVLDRLTAKNKDEAPAT